MRLLLDTHALIWYMEDQSKLTDNMVELIGSPSSYCCVSIVSFWEMAIKLSLGKLEMGYTLGDLSLYLTKKDIIVLPILLKHVEIYQTLPFHHRDPFDQMLIAPAACEDLTLVSRDPHFAAYPVRVAW